MSEAFGLLGDLHMSVRLGRGWLLAMALAAACLSTSATAARNSSSYCAAEAERAARNQGTVLGGATRSAAKGAVFGAIVGNKKSAKRGAALGAIVGGAHRAEEKNDAYNRVYDRCMYGY
jgi:uncharacterized protein YcfJ